MRRGWIHFPVSRRGRPLPAEHLCGYCGEPVARNGLLLRLEDGLWSGFDSWPCLLRFASAELHPASRRERGAQPAVPPLRVAVGGRASSAIVHPPKLRSVPTD